MPATRGSVGRSRSRSSAVTPRPTKPVAGISSRRRARPLNHPNIATIHDIARVEGTDFIVMEYVAGKPLSALVRSRMSVDEGIRAAISHCRRAQPDPRRRYRPPGPEAGQRRPGRRRHGQGPGLRVGQAVGARRGEGRGRDAYRALQLGGPRPPGGDRRHPPAYVSPEQAAGGRVDARSDIFSFGALVYEMVTGRRPFQGSSAAATLVKVMRGIRHAHELAPEVPEGLERIILRCLRKEPERRFQYMADVRVELQELEEEWEAAGSRSRGAASATAPGLARGGARGCFDPDRPGLAFLGQGRVSTLGASARATDGPAQDRGHAHVLPGR